MFILPLRTHFYARTCGLSLDSLSLGCTSVWPPPVHQDWGWAFRLLCPMACLRLYSQDGSHFLSCPKGDHWHKDHPGQRCPESCDRNSYSSTGSKTPFHPTHRLCTYVQAFPTGMSVRLQLVSHLSLANRRKSRCRSELWAFNLLTLGLLFVCIYSMD